MTGSTADFATDVVLDHLALLRTETFCVLYFVASIGGLIFFVVALHVMKFVGLIPSEMHQRL